MRRWRTLHQWLGLGAAVFFGLIASTGALLLLGDIFDTPGPTLPDDLVGDPIGAEAIIRIAEEKTDLTVSSLRICRGRDQMWVAELVGGDRLFLAPGGHVVGRQPLPVYTGVLSLALRLHTGGIAGKGGHAFMLVVSMAMLGSIGTGVLIWPWLRRRMKQ